MNLIERFSEDVDLAMDRSYFGYSGKLSKKQVNKLRGTFIKSVTKISPLIYGPSPDSLQELIKCSQELFSSSPNFATVFF